MFGVFRKNLKKIKTSSIDMTFRRRNAGVVAHNGLLYVVGGDDGTSNLANVEVTMLKMLV